MFNFRLSGIAAGLAFVLSLLTGLLSGTLPPALFLRPLIFAVLFFIIVNVISLLISRFLPELLVPVGDEKKTESPDVLMPGGNINIMEDNVAVPTGIYARPNDSEDDMGNIASLSNFGSSSSTDSAFSASPGMDQSGEYGYTEEGLSPAGSENGGDTLPDFDSLAGAFSSGSDEEEDDDGGFQDLKVGSSTPERTPVGNQPKKMEGDFDPKQLAEGIRTILKKDEG